ncbi:MAG: hypothetical protein PHS82_08820 [Lachnospiraceae bacterium]|nr:hypothetical protein [Lachnospiraceae bacterium]
MNKRAISIMQKMAAYNGLHMDIPSETVYGMKHGYQVWIAQQQNSLLSVNFSVCRPGGYPKVEEINPVLKATRCLGKCTVSKNVVSVSVKDGLSKKGPQKVEEALQVMTAYFGSNGYKNCCQNCEETEGSETYILAGNRANLCPNCFQELSTAMHMQLQTKDQKKENVVAGIVGALLGALIGAVAIVILGQLGYVASLSGLLMGVCALKGYELLGGKMSTKGIVLSVIIMLGMVYVGHRCDWAISAANYFGVDVFQTFGLMPDFIAEGYIGARDYFTGLTMVYVFAALGAVPTIVMSLSNQKKGTLTYKMQNTNADVEWY